MRYLLKQLGLRPFLTMELLIASLFVNILALAAPVFVIQVLNRYVAFGVDATLITLVSGALLAVLFEFLFRLVRIRLAGQVTDGPAEQTNLGIFNHLTGISLTHLDKITPGMRRQILQAGENLQTIFSPTTLVSLMDLPFLLLFLAGVYLLSPPLAMIAGAFVLAMLVISITGFLLMLRPQRDLMKHRSETDRLNANAVQAAETVRAFNARGYLIEKWRVGQETAAALTRKLVASRARLQGLAHGSSALLTIAIISAGALLVVDAKLDVGALIGANILAARALAEANRFAGQIENLARARQARKLVKELSQLPLERQQGSTLKGYTGALSLEDVSFKYSSAPAPLFEHLSLQLEPGSILVLQGDNGAGKSTLCRLLAGLLEPDRGRVTAAGVDLKQALPEWWRQQVSFLPQEADLLNASILDNLKLNAPDADTVLLTHSVDAAGVRKFIEESPDGFDTMITENGRTLARGTRRRLALARALVNQGPVVIFDEPTEGLDQKGCEAVYQILNRLTAEGRTIITASQDPKIMQAAHYLLDLNHKPIPLLRAKAGHKPKPSSNGKIQLAANEETGS